MLGNGIRDNEVHAISDGQVVVVAYYTTVVSYPTLNEIGIKDHQYWGLLLLVPLFHGPGTLSLNHFIRKRLWRS